MVFASDPKVRASINSSASLENLSHVQWRFDGRAVYGAHNMKPNAIAQRVDTGLNKYLAEIGQIKQSIKLALSNQVKAIRLPVHLLEKISKVRRVAFEMAHDLGREPSDDELAEAIGMRPERVGELRNGSVRPVSLDAAVADDDSVEFGEIIADEDAQTSYEWLCDRDLQVHLKAALKVLDDREKKIVLERFGLHGGQPKTLEQVGKAIGVTRERIRQLQARALSKLRHALTKDSSSAPAGLLFAPEAA